MGIRAENFRCEALPQGFFKFLYFKQHKNLHYTKKIVQRPQGTNNLLENTVEIKKNFKALKQKNRENTRKAKEIQKGKGKKV